MPSLYISVFVSLVFLFVSVRSQEVCSAPASVPVAVEGPSPAPVCRFDYVVSLKHPRFRSHICSGALIAPSWVLTLGSCAVDMGEMPVAHLNGVFREGPFTEAIATTSVVVHERFTGDSSLDPFDVALYKLARPSTQIPISLATSTVSSSRTNSARLGDWRWCAGQTVDVVGWGRVGSQGALSDTLQLGENLPVVPCATDWPTTDDGFLCLTDSALTCPGSPVVILGALAGSDVQVGIVTQVMGDCGVADRSSPFLDVTPLRAWIAENGV